MLGHIEPFPPPTSTTATSSVTTECQARGRTGSCRPPPSRETATVSPLRASPLRYDSIADSLPPPSNEFAADFQHAPEKRLRKNRVAQIRDTYSVHQSSKDVNRPAILLLAARRQGRARSADASTLTVLARNAAGLYRFTSKYFVLPEGNPISSCRRTRRAPLPQVPLLLSTARRRSRAGPALSR